MSDITWWRNVLLDQVISEVVILAAVALGRARVFLVIKRRLMVGFHRVCFLLATLRGRCFWLWEVPFVIVRNITRVGQNASNYSDEEAYSWITEDKGETDGPVATILPLFLVINPLSVKWNTVIPHFDSWFQVKEDVVDAEVCIETESDHQRNQGDHLIEFDLTLVPQW